MRDQLIGYLLDALDPQDHQAVEAQLSRDPQLNRDLDLIARSLLPLAADKQSFEPPSGLADRTCQVVFTHASASALRPMPAYAPSRWSLADMVVAAGIFIAAATLFLPALGQSRFAARVNGCRDNLRQIGIALNDYSTQHNGFFPNIPLEGSMAGAGSYAPRLVEYGFILNPYLVVCPASQWADPDANFYVPLPPELRNSRGAQLVRLQRMMGGSYGYSLGHVSDGHYSPPKNLGRRTFVLMADAPSGDLPHHSLNHGGSGQNALFEDMHVQFLNSCRPDGCRDHIYLNHHGLIAAGVDEDDSVVGASDSIPMLTPAANRSQ